MGVAMRTAEATGCMHVCVPTAQHMNMNAYMHASGR